MSIKIPKTIRTYCANKENTEAMGLICKDKGNQYSLSEIEKYYQAYLFAEKFKYDMWKFRLTLWRVVWGKLLKEYVDTDCQEDCLSMDEYESSFYVEYKFGTKKYRFQIVDFDGKDSELFILVSSLNKNDNEKAVITDSDIKNYANLFNEDYEDDSGTYTRGKTSIDMKNKKEITDDEIEKLREEARTILEALNISFSE